MEKFILPNMNKEESITKTIRIKYGLLERLKQVAKENNISVNRLIVESLEFALKNLEKEKVGSDSYF